MKQLIVHRSGQAWTIQFNGRDYDAFASQQAAVAKALEWAAKAERQGHVVRVLLAAVEVEKLHENQISRICFVETRPHVLARRRPAVGQSGGRSSQGSHGLVTFGGPRLASLRRTLEAPHVSACSDTD
ncbi:hypothetical protein [Rhodoligotrophos ferricapiens]|uniref:hypothetical protein n=1 Tax=Rhodoligotrophos ferricapiens TaxID=3069264 RepID=UPI00315DF333